MDSENKQEKGVEFRKGIFVITDEVNCPLYNVGEELTVEQNWVTMPLAKSTCLILASDIAKLSMDDVAYEHHGIGEKKPSAFECSGCGESRIAFEFKKEKEFTTLPMRLLAATERKEKHQEVSLLADRLRGIALFDPLTVDDLIDLSTLLIIKEYTYGYPICQKGDPGTHLYIILSGNVEVLDDDGVVLSEMETGDVFGEMSLLSGDRVSTTIMATEPCEIATLNQKNFKHILNKYPALQVFLYKLVVKRINDINSKRAKELASGMNGQVADFPLVELCQMMNANRKTGRLKIEYNDTMAYAVFNEGDLVYAEMNKKTGKEAFYDLLAIDLGRFQFSQGLTSRERNYQVVGEFMGMLMEGMRRVDDQKSSE